MKAIEISWSQGQHSGIQTKVWCDPDGGMYSGSTNPFTKKNIKKVVSALRKAADEIENTQNPSERFGEPTW